MLGHRAGRQWIRRNLDDRHYRIADDVALASGKEMNTERAAPIRVMNSAAADDESMKFRPRFVGATAGSSASTMGTVPVLAILPSAFSSIVLSPPRMLPCVGWEPSRFALLD